MSGKLIFHIHTYGCQMNERDSELAAGLLLEQGHQQADNEQDADLIIVNTCSVRAKAEDKALGKLGLLLASRRQKPDLIVGVVGCMVQRMQQDLWRTLPGLDFALGPQHITRLPEVLQRVRCGEGPCLEIDECRPESRHQPHTGGKIAAFINILYGCNRRCSYCIVPRVRGPEFSRTAAEIIEEARGLLASGVRDITLLGQSVMSYGRSNPVWPLDHHSPRGFHEPLPRLLEALSALPRTARLRFTSGHPSGCTAELARAMAELPPVCEHLHLPLQSGSDRILKLMRRGYTSKEYRQAVRRLREALPDIAITTDIIVGFPGETAGDFAMTADFMAEMQFDNAFIFKYNPRPDTPAAAWPDDVPDEEKMQRNQLLLTAQNRHSLESNRCLVGRTLEVLVTGPSRRNAARWSGRTRTNKIVVFSPREHIQRGDLITVPIDSATAQALYGPQARVDPDADRNSGKEKS
ncbi:MAG: tRNA (N6-isopentenyl adenosine(37)-C2)-methylthiotransferase MiaB [Kiritimatiellia bacterium]|nr:tRNA (N6-isopentenyl adenosine(37)-C2)-methylthiotransferase MiaB [Lentisphaerota bacterium]